MLSYARYMSGPDPNVQCDPNSLGKAPRPLTHGGALGHGCFGVVGSTESGEGDSTEIGGAMPSGAVAASRATKSVAGRPTPRKQSLAGFVCPGGPLDVGVSWLRRNALCRCDHVLV